MEMLGDCHHTASDDTEDEELLQSVLRNLLG